MVKIKAREIIFATCCGKEISIHEAMANKGMCDQHMDEYIAELNEEGKEDYMKETMSNGDILDLGSVKQFKLPTIERYFEKYDKTIKSEKLNKANLDKIAKQRLKNGKDFLITNPESVDKNGNKTEDGIFSPRFGYTQFDDQLGTRDAYRCQCGALAGAIYLGELCDECGTTVQFMDADLTIMGWIPMNQYVVINPSLYIHLDMLFGKGELEEVLKVNASRISVDGIMKAETDPKKPYHGTGMLYLYENIEKIMEYYLNSNPKKKDHYDLLVENQDSIFTHFVPVYSAIIRPRIESNEKVRLFQANKIYDTIMNHYQLITNEPGNMLAILPALHEIQQEFNELYDLIVETYAGKEGMFRSNFGGVRIDYAARSIIVPGVDLKPDEVEIPYVSAIVFLELELIYLLCIVDDITENEAYKIINDSLRTFNPRIHALAQSIVDKSKTPVCVLVGRPPTLSDRSIRLLTVKRIGNSVDNLCMRLSPSLLDGYKGDHDGDSLYYIPLKDWRLIKTFEQTLSPKYNYVSRTTGLYSNRMEYIKDYIIVLSELYALGKEAEEEEEE
jgi:hypothetical protein